MENTRSIVAILLIAAITIGSAGCAAPAKAADLMAGISPNSIAGKPADAEFTAGMADFSVELFKKSIAADKNSLVSPLSVMLALAMTANGAGGETLAQMERVLGGGISIDDLNEYLFYYAQNLSGDSKTKLSIANSIWLRDIKSLEVFQKFLQTNADYYRAAAFKSAFDEKTLRDINNWVSTNTDGMIESILSKIDDAAMLYLINAVAFDAQWQEVYTENSVRDNDFMDISGNIQSVEFMYSTEWSYLDDGKATGFVKPYAGGKYSFAALLPNEGVSPDAYIETLTGTGLLETLRNAQMVEVRTSMPKFEYEYDISLEDALKTLGMADAFSAQYADFSKMGESKDGSLYIDRVIHKTFIKVDERGTKAGAATAVVMAPGAAPQEIVRYKVVYLDRPFIFAIIDNATNLPIFIGTLMTV